MRHRLIRLCADLARCTEEGDITARHRPLAQLITALENDSVNQNCANY
jgi:hypothetical protein